MAVEIVLMIAAGIGLALAVSDPGQVTARWLRLGGIVAVSLIAVAETVAWMAGPSGGGLSRALPVAVALPFVGQLLAVQVGKRGFQRALAAASALLGATAVGLLLVDALGRMPEPAPRSVGTWLGIAGIALLGSGLVGGTLMTMLLGHAYLTAGNEMTQRPFMRLVGWVAGFVVARAAVSAAVGLWPYTSAAGVTIPRAGPWEAAMLTARYLVGLAVPAVFAYMTYDCVKRRANQSATGILYVACVLVLLGEGIALGLFHATGFAF